MTKPNKITGSTFWYSHPHTLSHKGKATLREALGIGDADTQKWDFCRQRIEYALGFYRGGVAALDNGPTARDLQREISAVNKKAVELIVALTNLSSFAREPFDVHLRESWPELGFSATGGAAHELTKIMGACESTLKNLEPAIKRKDSRGRKPAIARNEVLKALLGIYEEFSQQTMRDRKSSGASTKLSKFEQQQLRFVRAAFREISLDNFEDGIDGDKKWLELIRAAKKDE